MVSDMGWQMSVGPAGPARRARQVFIYTAVVGLKVERSKFAFDSSIDRQELAAAIESPPRWHLDPWPPQLTFTDADLTILAFAKLKALFDFMAMVPNGSAQEIRAALYALFPAVDPDVQVSGFKRFPVEASILDNGDATWGYDIPAGDDFPPGVTGGMKESDLDLFIQNLVRADLQEHLESLR
jgi:hypothetical protein